MITASFWAKEYSQIPGPYDDDIFLYKKNIIITTGGVFTEMEINFACRTFEKNIP